MSFITQACVNTWYSRARFDPVSALFTLFLPVETTALCASRRPDWKQNRGSRLLAAGEYVDRGCERKKRIWRSNALQWEDVKRSLADVSLQPQLSLRLFLLLTNSILSCRSLLSCHVAVVSSASAQRGQYGEVCEVTPGVNTDDR